MSKSPQLHQSDFIDEAMAKTLPALFLQRVKRSPDNIAYTQYDEKAMAWRNYTWQEIHLLVQRWRQALLKEKLAAGDRVAVMLGNSVEWVCFDQAAQSLGLVIVSLYTTDTTDNVTYILDDAGVQVLLIAELEQWKNIKAHQAELPALQSVWCLQNKCPEYAQYKKVYCVEDILPAKPLPYEQVQVEPDSLATIIYTSGTTGRPKGVMLSHHNILSNAEAVQKLVPAYPADIFLSFLPLAHSFERTVEYYFPMMAGSHVCYARSIQTLIDDLPEIKPTILLSAPRLYEKIYAAIQGKVAAHWLKYKLFEWTISLGWQEFEFAQNRGAPLNIFKRLMGKVLHKIVAEKVLTRLGGRLRVAVTGAAPMSEKVSRFFLGLGLPLIEGYGLTEASPVVAANSLENNIPGSVGEAVFGVEVSIADNGELLVRSPGVMLGYWHKEDATNKAIDKRGWLHTGDLAEIKQGRVYIRGRLKEILVTSTGEKVAPADMETTITLDPLFDQAMVVGEGKPFLAALLVLEKQAWTKLASELGLDATDVQSLQSSEAIGAVLNKLSGLLSSFPVYAQIHSVYLTCEAWTIENGLLTPTLKIKRKQINERFSQQITELYRGHLMLE
jgi:long-chain acyl-CoA synthetase